MDPILEYLLEFNKTNPIEYSSRYIIPPGGLAKMLEDFRGFYLNKVIVTKDELMPPAQPNSEVEELYKLLDD